MEPHVINRVSICLVCPNRRWLNIHPGGGKSGLICTINGKPVGENAEAAICPDDPPRFPPLSATEEETQAAIRLSQENARRESEARIAREGNAAWTFLHEQSLIAEREQWPEARILSMLDEFQRMIPSVSCVCQNWYTQTWKPAHPASGRWELIFQEGWECHCAVTEHVNQTHRDQPPKAIPTLAEAKVIWGA